MRFEADNAYIYRTGQLYSLNFGTTSKGFGSALLIRAITPCCNPKVMYKRRIAFKRWKVFNDKTHRLMHLCNGPSILCEALAVDGEHYKKSKEGLSLFGSPFEIREAIEKPKLICGIRIGLDAQFKRWKKEQPDRASSTDINAAGEKNLSWAASEYKQYCSPYSFDKKWTLV